MGKLAQPPPGLSPVGVGVRSTYYLSMDDLHPLVVPLYHCTVVLMYIPMYPCTHVPLYPAIPRPKVGLLLQGFNSRPPTCLPPPLHSLFALVTCTWTQRRRRLLCLFVHSARNRALFQQKPAPTLAVALTRPVKIPTGCSNSALPACLPMTRRADGLALWKSKSNIG